MARTGGSYGGRLSGVEYFGPRHGGTRPPSAATGTPVPEAPAARSKYPPLPEIASVELLLMIVGIDAVISRAVEKVGKGKLREMAAIPKEIQTLARKMVNGELTPVISLSDFNWRQAVTELAAGWDVEQIIETCKQFPSDLQAAASALVIKSQDLIKQLSVGLPLDEYQTIAGSKKLVPADAKIFKFASVLEVIRNPLLVFSLMAAGALLKLQANAVRQTYPTLSAAIDAAIIQATMAAKADKKSFELPPRAEYGVRAWFGNSPIPTGALKQSQANVAAVNKRNAQPKAPPGKPPSLLTAGERAEAKAPPTP